MITDKVEKRKSKIHGFGLFARQDIKKGEIISIETNFIKKPITEPLDKEWKTYSYRYNDFYILPLDNGRFINHSSNPNVIEAMIAARDIKAGEELTEDYSSYTEVPSTK